VFDREPEFFEQVEKKLQLLVAEPQAGEASAEDGDAEQAFAVENGDGDLSAKDLELAAGIGGESVRCIRLKNTTVRGDGRADASVEGELEEAVEIGGDAGGARAGEPA